jgi:hypothetical protein
MGFQLRRKQQFQQSIIYSFIYVSN